MPLDSAPLDILSFHTAAIIPATVSWEVKKDRRCHVKVIVGGNEEEAEGSDCFEAFCSIRRRLEERGLQPICYGASLDVFPSGMCRDMDNGLYAYRMSLPKEERIENMAHIFDSGPDVRPATVDEQEAWVRDKPRLDLSNGPDGVVRFERGLHRAELAWQHPEARDRGVIFVNRSRWTAPQSKDMSLSEIREVARVVAVRLRVNLDLVSSEGSERVRWSAVTW